MNKAEQEKARTSGTQQKQSQTAFSSYLSFRSQNTRLAFSTFQGLEHPSYLGVLSPCSSPCCVLGLPFPEFALRNALTWRSQTCSKLSVGSDRPESPSDDPVVPSTCPSMAIGTDMTSAVLSRMSSRGRLRAFFGLRGVDDVGSSASSVRFSIPWS